MSPTLRLRAIVLVLVAGLALADASIVTLALPELLVELDTGVEGVAAVLGVYTGVLALVLVPAWWIVRARGPALVGAIGLVVFALSAVACGVADSLPALLLGRAVGAAGAAAGLVAAFALVTQGASEPLGRRLWPLAAVVGTATGPALGGALTQAFDWRAIFLVQAPIALAGAAACVVGGREEATRAGSSPSADPAPGAARRGAAAIALALVSAAGYSRFIRGSMLEVIHQDYIRTARAKGLREKLVVLRHAFKNAALPFVTLVALDIPDLFTGAVVTETIFAWPGMGRLYIESIGRLDYSVLMAILTVSALLLILSNLLADIVYGLLDPRIRYG